MTENEKRRPSVLIAYGSKRGGTRGIAETILAEFHRRGFAATVVPAADRSADPADYDAVVICGGLYAMHWDGSARRFAARHRAVLRERPVWLVSSGPLDDTAATSDLPPVSGVERIAQRIGARGCQTFGGRLEPDAKGFVASRMARSMAGDWRDGKQIAGWVDRVADELAAGQRVTSAQASAG